MLKCLQHVPVFVKKSVIIGAAHCVVMILYNHVSLAMDDG